jgi:hypothetical protein
VFYVARYGILCFLAGFGSSCVWLMAKILFFCGPTVTEQWIQGECQDPRNPCAPCTMDHIHMTDAVWYVCVCTYAIYGTSICVYVDRGQLYGTVYGTVSIQRERYGVVRYEDDGFGVRN